MTENEYINNLTIYCSYHNDQIYNNYNLNNIPSYIKLFKTSDINMPGESINHLNQHLSELVTFYYVWKNKLYSPYVGFCHYSRFFINLGYENIKKYNMHYFGIVQFNVQYDHRLNDFRWLIVKLYDYLLQTNKFNKDILDKIFYEKDIINIPWKECYIFTWEKFNEACELYFNFLELVIPKFKYINSYDNTGRYFAYCTEVLLGLIITILNDNIYLENTNLNTYLNRALVTNYDDKLDLMLWIQKNNRTNVRKYIISNLNLYDVCELTDTYKLYFEENKCIFIKSKSEIFDENIIMLKMNEYINCVDSIEFMKDNYTIENI